ncbi:hypothetical protein ACQ86N_38810 [Puia sp. P3]|uniref:hypothetical protein n=1 Tax=Puia sp. P3 TaxID=3423952 RepID=UPI003D664EFF
MDTLYRLFGKQDIRIGAQYYLKKFYETFGFVQKETSISKMESSILKCYYLLSLKVNALGCLPVDKIVGV